jgi:FG-GAP-like repeat
MKWLMTIVVVAALGAVALTAIVLIASSRLPLLRRSSPTSGVSPSSAQSGQIRTSTIAAEKPLLAPAPGSPVPVAGGALAAGDVNGDHLADLVLVNETSLQVTFGDATRRWPKDPDASTELAASGSEIALADLDGDGRLDVVLADHNSYKVAVLRGDGAGRFEAFPGSPVTARDGNQPHTHGLVVVDLNGDEHPDIVTANNADGDVSVLLGDGRGSFTRANGSPFACGRKPYPIAAADINGDGHADLLVPNALPEDLKVRTLTILLGNGRGQLTAAPNSPLVCDASLWYVAAGDLDGDEQTDVVATHTEGGTAATVLLNSGQGELSPAPSSPLQFGHGAWGVEIADMDRDGKADLVIAADETIRVLLGDGRGGFQPAAGSPYTSGKGAWRLVVADVNGDGKLDVATRCVEAKRLEILLGN